MKQCKASPEDFPKVRRGDVVQYVETGDCYLVARAAGGDYSVLVALSDGNIWCSDSLWGARTTPEEWRKVDCCFMITEPDS